MDKNAFVSPYIGKNSPNFSGFICFASQRGVCVCVWYIYLSYLNVCMSFT